MRPIESRLPALGVVVAVLATYTLWPLPLGDHLPDTFWWIWFATLPVICIACLIIGVNLWRTGERPFWGFALVCGPILFYVPFWCWFINGLSHALADG